MAHFYTNENIPVQVVTELRRLGHDVMTSLDAGKANSAMPDAEVPAFAVAEGRILLTHNRRHFQRLHQGRTADHRGIVVCTSDAEFAVTPEGKDAKGTQEGSSTRTGLRARSARVRPVSEWRVFRTKHPDRTGGSARWRLQRQGEG